MPKRDCLILTCRRDRHLAELLKRGLERFWPEVRPVLVEDIDGSTETELPDDVRAVARAVPYLRRVFDFPHIATTEQYVVLDSDCLIYRPPVEFEGLKFQGNPNGSDRGEGLRLWREFGHPIDCKQVRFCSGMYSVERSLFLDNRDLAIDWVRRCVAKGYDRCAHRGVICCQSLTSGLWRMKYPHAPLPPEAYPYGTFVPGCAIWHMSSTVAGNPYGQSMLSAYEAML